MNNNYNKYNKYKNYYKEKNYKYIGAQSYAEIIRQLQREREKKEINQIVSYINSLNKNERDILLNICRQIANVAPNKSIQVYIGSLTTAQIINLFNSAILRQRQSKKPQQYQSKQSHFQASTTQAVPQTQTSQSASQPSKQTQTTQSAPKSVQTTKSIPKQIQSNTQVTQSSTQPSQKTQQSKQPKTIIRIFNTLKSKLKLQNKPTQQKSTQTTQVVDQPQIQQNSQTPPKPTMAILDKKNKWSPISYTGKIYDFNRGVIGIDENGQKHKIILDGSNRHHNDATSEIGIRTNCRIKNIYAGPFEIGIEVAKQGVTIIQLEGNSMLIYLPDEITPKQLESLKTETIPRKKFDLSFTHKDYIYDNVNEKDLYTMLKSILAKEKVLTKAS